MSFWARPMVAANSAVIAPIIATMNIAVGAWVKMTEQRTIIYTPAVTIVAAWIRADTGVGPAMASGSHTYKGICALLPTAPMNRRIAIEVTPPYQSRFQAKGSTGSLAMACSAVLPTAPAAGFAKKLTEQDLKNVSIIPSTNPQSPMRLVMNAFLAASPASWRSM